MKGKHDKNYDEGNLSYEENAQQQAEYWSQKKLNELQAKEYEVIAIASTDSIQTSVGGIANVRVGKLPIYETLEQILADVWKISLKEITVQELAMKIQRTVDAQKWIANGEQG